MKPRFILPILALLLGSCITKGFCNKKDSEVSPKDTITAPLSDSVISSVEQQESEFQSYLDTLFMGVDTFAWDNKMINSGHFNSKDMTDTINIVLVDSAKQIYYCPPFKNYITSNFGPRRWMWHFGIDIKLNVGDTVCAAFDGIVRVTKFDRRGFGWVVVIRHPSGLETIYGHLTKILVNPNQKVKAGETIGLGGSTGRSTGSHLHFETRFRGEPFNPNYFIDFANYKVKSCNMQLTKSNFEYLVDIRKAKFYKIRKGDTLSKIAVRYHTSVRTLCALNHITTKTLLRVGRTIRYQ